jgi:hypothetical protein
MLCILSAIDHTFQEVPKSAEYKTGIPLAMDNVYGPLQDLGIDLMQKGHYVGVLASRNPVTLPQDTSGHLVAVLKKSIIASNWNLPPVFPPKYIFSIPFDGCRQRVKRLRTNSGYNAGREQQWHLIAIKRRKLREAKGVLINQWRGDEVVEEDSEVTGWRFALQAASGSSSRLQLIV